MRVYLDCYPCLLRQALQAARMAGGDDDQQHIVVQRVLALLHAIPATTTPPEIAYQVHRIVRDQIGVSDPYREVKATSTTQALALYPRLKALIEAADDPLDVAIRLSIAGNIIDFAVGDDHADLWATVERCLTQPFAIDHIPALRRALESAPHALFLADNAGETVFDRVLIETLDVPVVYAVKSGPALNDATHADAVAAGLDQVAALTNIGIDAPGTSMVLCSPEFRERYESAPLIIAKGQANYETLSTSQANLFFLLQIKCPVIAKDVGAPVGSLIVRHAGSAV